MKKKIPGQIKTGKQIIFNSDLIFNVLKKHEPNHILLQAAREDSYRGLIDLDRLNNFFKRIKNKTIHQKLERVSPLAVPLILEINRETINKSDVNDFYLEELENQILTEVGLN